MDEAPEPGKLPTTADEALERLLSREDRIRFLPDVVPGHGRGMYP